ncbi:TrmH family RNA methyltransferase [Diplocloster modestus]|uniref:RNA methyltransferase n=1 Tax=Diplocloster modestus TaxID=2850322 RepID=A0ABS6K4B8_9FIRM|nr:RNA methyltransferase [Diplocloster modestus]MBU9725379.1 RNA methyltransferase [Diplocloster modestus]
MITSTHNQQVKHVMQLNRKPRLRNEEGVFVVEGFKMVKEAPRDRIVKAYVSASALADSSCQALLADLSFEAVEDQVFTQMSDTQTPQGILAVIKRQEPDPDQLLEQTDPFLLLIENLQDPGNLGTMIRTAEGAGVTGILISRESVDLYNPKTIRSTMGSIYRVPVHIADSLTGLIPLLHQRGIRTYAAHLRGTESYTDADYQKGTAFLIGNEGNGLTEELADAADQYIRIPMEGQVESLNAAMAAGILMYEVKRQRTGSK